MGATYSDGTFTWSIPWYYHIGGTDKQFKTVDQVKQLQINSGKATLSISKAGSSASVSEP